MKDDALNYAIFRGLCVQKDAPSREYLETKFKKSFLTKRGRNSETLLHLAETEEVVQFLADKGFNLDDTVPRKGCPLTFAAERGNIKVVRKLLKLGANPDIPNSGGPLICAIQKGHANIVEELVRSGANVPHSIVIRSYPNPPNVQWQDVILRACKQSRWKRLRLIFVGSRAPDSPFSCLPRDMLREIGLFLLAAEPLPNFIVVY